MCVTCGYSICNCPSVTYSQNWYNTQSCTPCSTTEVCKKNIPAKCTFYKGSNLANLGLTTNINIELILYTIDLLIGSLNSNRTLDNAAQVTKNTNILTALNDINDRLNTLEGGAPHDPYTI
jgi:hypothetical protein